MDFDFTELPAQDRYRLPTNFVGPRPIALVSALSPIGQDNAATMSFFNVFKDCLDAAGRYVDPSHYQPIGRLHAYNCITSDRQYAHS